MFAHGHRNHYLIRVMMSLLVRVSEVADGLSTLADIFRKFRNVMRVIYAAFFLFSHYVILPKRKVPMDIAFVYNCFILNSDKIRAAES